MGSSLVRTYPVTGHWMLLIHVFDSVDVRVRYYRNRGVAYRVPGVGLLPLVVNRCALFD